MKVEERLEIVDHTQFLRLRSHILRDYTFMMTIPDGHRTVGRPELVWQVQCVCIYEGGIHSASWLVYHRAQQWPGCLVHVQIHGRVANFSPDSGLFFAFYFLFF